MKIQTIASGSSGNCYIIHDNGHKLMIECGIPVMEIRHHGGPLTEIDAVLISHEHKDHSRSIKQLTRMGVPCYTSHGTASALDMLNDPYVIVITEYANIIMDYFSVLPFPVYHDAAEPMGFLIRTSSGKTILFITDTCYISERFENITHLMVECNYDPATMDKNEADGLLNSSLKQRIIETHFGLENVVRMLDSNDWNVLEEIHVLHMSDQNADALYIQKMIRQVTGVPVYLT